MVYSWAQHRLCLYLGELRQHLPRISEGCVPPLLCQNSSDVVLHMGCAGYSYMNVQLPASLAMPVLPCFTCQEHALADSATCASCQQASASSAIFLVSQPAALKSSAIEVFVLVNKEGCLHTQYQSAIWYRMLAYHISTCPVSAFPPFRKACCTVLNRALGKAGCLHRQSESTSSARLQERAAAQQLSAEQCWLKARQSSVH